MAHDETNDVESDLLEPLGSSDRATQRVACERATALLRQKPEFRETLHGWLLQSNPRLRFAAAYVLFRAGRATLRLLPALLDSLELDDGDLRWTAAHMLATLGRMQAEVCPVLLHECRNAASPRRRRMAVYALRELAPERAETQQAFLGALGDSDSMVRRASLSSLAKLTAPGRSCLERVLEIARSDPDARMQSIAAVVLPDLVSQHPATRDEVAAELQRLANTDDLSLVRSARAALQRLAQRPV
jgi:HEAT repeat protein